MTGVNGTVSIPAGTQTPVVVSKGAMNGASTSIQFGVGGNINVGGTKRT